jgi:hypothetical protein
MSTSDSRVPSGSVAGVLRWVRQVRSIVVKEWRQLLRDRALLGFVIFIFSLDILIAAGSPDFDLRMARVGVIDRDHSVGLTRPHLSVARAAIRAGHGGRR